MSGVQMTVDPRWVIASRGDDVALEVESQLGAVPQAGSDEEWREIRGGVVDLLVEELESGAQWAAAFLVREPEGSLVVARASARFELELVEEPGTLYDDVLLAHRDDPYRTTLQLVETRIGVAVHQRQLLELPDAQPLEYDAFLIPGPSGGWLVECFCSPVGWAGLWGPSLESMVLSLQPDATVPEGTISLVTFVISGVE